MKQEFMLISQQKITTKVSDLFLIKRQVKDLGENDYFKKYISHHHLLWTGSGREALRQILLYLDKNNHQSYFNHSVHKLNQKKVKKKKIGMPMFTCYVVLDAVKRAGYEPVFYDCGIIAEVKNIEKIITDVDVLIVCHNFGFIAEMEKIALLCKQNKVILIEDCAQALGASYHERLAGSFGDYAFFSFGISKNIGFCGGLISSKERMKMRGMTIEGIEKFSFKRLMKAAGEVLIAPLFFNKYLYPLTSQLLKNELRKEQEPLSYSCPRIAMKAVLNQFKRYYQILERRRKNAEYCLRELEGLRQKGLIDFVKPIERSNPAWLYFTLLVDEKRSWINKKSFVNKLFKEGVELGEMSTFRCLCSNSEGKSKASETEKRHLTFALYRSFKEIKLIVKKIKLVCR